MTCTYRSLEAGAQPGTGLSVRRPRLLSLSLYYICLFGKGAYRLLGRNFLFQALASGRRSARLLSMVLLSFFRASEHFVFGS